MPTPTVENYLKALYDPAAEAGGLISMGRIAEAMRVSPGTATAMMKTLAEADLVVYEPRSGARLTQHGRTLALQVLRRHRLIELFLVRTLGLDWSQVHDEAEELEHAISDKVLERIDQLLGHPVTDPHGDPIPNAAGKMHRLEMLGMDQCEVGELLVVARVVDQDAPFLQFLERSGLTPGATVTITARDTLAGALTVQPADTVPVTLGFAAAAKIMVEAAVAV